MHIATDHVHGFDRKTIGDATSAFVTICLATNYAFVDLVRARDEYPDVLLQQINVDTRRSRSGKLIMVGSATRATSISHKSSLQKIISLSTTASEIISLMETVTDLVAARRLLKEMGYEQLQPTRVMEDNQPAIALVRDQARMEGATKHTDMRHLKLRELQANGVFEVQYCRTSCMLADLFTKNLPAQTFNALADFATGRRGDYSAEPLVTKDGRAMLIYLA